MNRKEIAQGVAQFVNLAYISPLNLNTGFLTHHYCNPLPKDQVEDFSKETEVIITQLVQHVQTIVDKNKLTNNECATLFQYIFDKVTEATIKMIMEEEVDTQFDLNEAFRSHEPDLPANIRQTITNVVDKITIINSTILQFLDDNNARTKDLDDWLTAYLLDSAIIAIQFAQEIDLEDVF